MSETDNSGFVLTNASAKAAESYRQAVAAYHCYQAAAFEHVEAAIADSPAFIMAHVLRAQMTAVGSAPEYVAMAAQSFEAVRDVKGDDRERGHVAALGALLSGQIHRAGRILEDVSAAAPRDAVALQAGQIMDFLVGDSRMLRDRITRAAPAWSSSQPDYHALLGMLSFGLEETGLYDRAEAAGREAIDLEPTNAWAQHAVAHVLEMEDRRVDGVAWMTRDADAWSRDGVFAVHNWWHLALFHLGLDDTEAVLKLYDGPIYGTPSTLAFDLVDAAALLWRLSLRGVDVNGRWALLADTYAAKNAFGEYAFDDAHAMLAFVGAGRADGVAAVLDAQRRALTEPGDNAIFVRDVGLPVMEAIAAFGEGDYRKATERLRDVRNRAARFGGSHAQRDLLDLTLIEAAARGGDRALERALRAERAAMAPSRPSGQRMDRAAA